MLNQHSDKRNHRPSREPLKIFWVQQLVRAVASKEVFAILKNSQRRIWSVRKGVLRTFVKLTGKHLCQGLLFNKVEGLSYSRKKRLSKKRLWHRCFPVNFTEFQETPFLQNTSGRLL